LFGRLGPAGLMCAPPIAGPGGQEAETTGPLPFFIPGYKLGVVISGQKSEVQAKAYGCSLGGRRKEGKRT